jgi:hypothetical protein
MCVSMILLKSHPEQVPWRPEVGVAPKLTDAEVVTLSVMAALLGYAGEAHWLCFARVRLRSSSPYLPKQPGYNKRLRNLGATIGWLITVLARDTSLFTDDCVAGRVHPGRVRSVPRTAKRSNLAGFMICPTSGGLVSQPVPVGPALLGFTSPSRERKLNLRCPLPSNWALGHASSGTVGRRCSATLSTGSS